MSRRNSLIRFAVSRQVTTGMAILGVLVLGGISLTRLPLEFLPTFSSSSITVNAPYASTSPEEMERLVVRPLEDSLGTISGVETMAATAGEGQGTVRLTFVDGTDMDLAAVEVRDRIDRARALLPGDLERITVRRFQSTDIPVIRLHLSSEWPQERLYEFAETVVQRRLERLPGVAQVTLRGVRAPEVQVNLDPERLAAHGVDLRTLSGVLQANHVNLSAGDLKERGKQLQVRVVGEFESLDEVRSMPLGVGSLRLSDVADVVYDYPRQDEFNFLNGNQALTVSINKTSTSNLLEVADAVKAELLMITELPEAEGLLWKIFSDASLDVRKGLSKLRDAGLLGGGLAILAVLLFMRRLRPTLVVAVAIPISVVATFVIMFLLRQAGVLDITLNVVSLTGLMLAIGMLVDPAIVVIESVYRHRNELGKLPREAAIDGAGEVALPILASTVTTVCVFVPQIFLSGGSYTRWLKDIGVTATIVVIAAFAVAMTVVPLGAAHVLRQGPRPDPRWIVKLNGLYGRLLAATLRHRALVVGVALALLGGAWWLMTGVERAFSSRSLERQITIHVDTPRQYSLEQTAALHREVFELLDAHRDELDVSDIVSTYDRGTGRSRGSWTGFRSVAVFLKDESESDLSTAEARDRIRELLPEKAGVNLRIAQSAGRHGSSGVELGIMGDDPSVLELLSKDIEGRLAAVPFLADIDTSLTRTDEEIQIGVERDRVAAAGLSSRAIAFTVQGALSSRPVAYFKTGDREVDFVMQYREDARETLDQLKNVPVRSAEGSLPLGALADFDVAEGRRSIERENRMAKIAIQANTSNPAMSFAAIGVVRRLMESYTLPPGYSWDFGRWTRFMQQDNDNAWFARAFALILVYMLMAALFEDFGQPIAILLSVVFAFIGVAVAMRLASQTWTAIAELGLLILIGVVVNNAIVLVDHINGLRATGLARSEAILRAGRNRLRPILMTAVTTIVGLAPMVGPYFLPQIFGTLEGRAAQWAPAGLIILGGMTTSTFLTLLIVPTAYSLIDDFTNWFRRIAREA